MIREYKTPDKPFLVEMFAHNLHTHSSYISHGELQMGISYDGTTLAPDFKEKWEHYLNRHHENEDSRIYVYEENTTIAGFIIFGTDDDHDKKFGVIYDMLLNDNYKGKGLGSLLLQAATDYFKTQHINDCYLESGVENHSAHGFFEHKGFKHVSNIYRLSGLNNEE